MRLPDPLYKIVKDEMMHHGQWHIARLRPREFPPPLRAPILRARQAFPNLKYLDEPGCGKDFLRFHRHMIQHFKWLVDNTPDHNYTFQPWPDLPGWFQQQLGPAFLAELATRIPQLIAGNSDDALGNYLEKTRLDTSPSSDVHNLAHGHIAGWEIDQYPGDQRLEDASMSDFFQAHHNTEFWALHGWIDEIFANWQRANGEAVDQRPIPPHHGTRFYSDMK